MQWAMLAISLAVSTMEVWTTSPLNTFTGDNRTHPTAAQSARLHAARGEYEGALFFVRAGRRGLEAVEPAVSPLGDHIPAPDIYRVGPVALARPGPRTLPGREAAPDVLHHPTPADLDKDETAIFYAVYYVPHDTPAGGYTGEIEIRSANKRTRSFAVTLEVFDFALPPVPQWKGLAPLDREPVCRTYGIGNRDLAAWQPIYDALAPWRLSFPVWTGGDLVTMDETEVADTTAFKEHLAYAIAAADMAAVDIMAHGRAVHLFPPPLPGDSHDSMHAYIQDMLGWLEDHGWRGRAYGAVMPAPPRDMWQHARSLYFRVWRASPRLPRLLVLPLHPYWERFTDWWAAPLPDLPPETAQRMKDGQSMVRFQPIRAHLTASPPARGAATGPANTAAGAGDGALVSAWWPEEAAKGGAAAYLEAVFDEPQPVKHVTIIWAGSRTADKPGIETSYDARTFAPAAVKWDHRKILGPYANSLSRGTLEHKKTVLAFRIVMPKTEGRPPGIAEVVLGEEPEPAQTTAMPPARPWLHLTAGAFPSPAPGAHPIEMRLLPWVCHAHGLTGFVLPGLTQWPRSWQPGLAAANQPWPASPDPGAALFYPGESAPLPSLRLLRLRDGMEDYAYLAALAEAVRRQQITALDARKLLGVHLYGPNPTIEELDALTREIEQVRIRLGRALAAMPEPPAQAQAQD
jgi:hypothetical protein